MRVLKLQAVGDLQLVELPQSVPGPREVLLRVEACKDGDTHLCFHFQLLGFSRDGGFADYVTVPAKNLHRLPKHLSVTAATLTEPLACCLNAFHGLYRGGKGLPKNVLIVGGGLMGCLLALVFQMHGIRRISVLESNEAARRRFAPVFRQLRLPAPVAEVNDVYAAGSPFLHECSRGPVYCGLRTLVSAGVRRRPAGAGERPGLRQTRTPAPGPGSGLTVSSSPEV